VIELLLSSSAPSLIASPPEVCADASNGASELQAMMMMRKVKNGLLSHLYIKVIFLPRQARDKHRENSIKARFVEGAIRDEAAGVEDASARGRRER
jgi:hypothetical protein